MRLITGDECGLLKEVVPEKGRPKSDDDDDDPHASVKPYHMDVADKVTKDGVKRIDAKERQTRERGVVDLAWMMDGDNTVDQGDSDGSTFQFAALRQNGSVQVWSATRDDPQRFGRYSVDYTTKNVLDGVKVPGGCRPLGLGYLSMHRRLCVGDAWGNLVVLDGATKQGEVITTYNAYHGSKRGSKISYTPGTFENTQMATAMAINNVQGRVAVGGRERETTLVDLETGQVVWKAKNLKPDPQTLLQQPVWPSAICFLGSECNTMAVGTGYKEVRLYDVRETSKQRRPTATTPEGLLEYRITSLCPINTTEHGHELVVGDAAGFLYQLDLRKLGRDPKVGAHKDMGRFVGPGGSVRQLKRHPKLPRLAAIGLDRMLRIYDTKTRKQLDCVYLKQRLNCVLFHGDDAWDVADATPYGSISSATIDPEDAGIDVNDVVQDYVDSDVDEVDQSDDLQTSSENDDSERDDDDSADMENNESNKLMNDDAFGDEEDSNDDDKKDCIDGDKDGEGEDDDHDGDAADDADAILNVDEEESDSEDEVVVVKAPKRQRRI